MAYLRRALSNVISLTSLNSLSSTFNIYLSNFEQLYLSTKSAALTRNYYLPDIFLRSSVDSLSYVFISNFLLNTTLYILIFGLVLFYSLSYGAKLFSNYISGVDLYQVTFNYFADLEEELGSADDALFYFLVFGLVIVWFFFLTVFSGFLQGNISWIVALLGIVAITAFVIPAFVLKNFGLAAVMYIAKKTPHCSETFFVLLLLWNLLSICNTSLMD